MGDLLVRLDLRDYELGLARARVQVAQAQVLLAREEEEAGVARQEWSRVGKGKATPLVFRESQLAPPHPNAGRDRDYGLAGLFGHSQEPLGSAGFRNGRADFALVFVLLALFLRLRLAFWVALGIPISFLGSIWVIPGIDASINLPSLFAFIVVLGIVVVLLK